MTPLLPLERFRSIIGLHPYWFWQLANTDNVPATSAVNQPLMEYAWQDADASGRQEIREAIEIAESKLRDYLGYAVAPRFTEQTLSYPRGMWIADADGRWLSISLNNEGHVQSVGIESKTVLQAGVTVTASDSDSDSVNDTFTLTTTATTTETDINRIAVYLTSGDRLDSESTLDRWLIEPVQKTINANGTVTIRGRYWLLVKPIKYQGVSTVALDPTIAGNFVTALDVYIRKTDPNGTTPSTSQAKLIWETIGCGCDVSIDGSTDAAATGEAIARAGIRDAELGILTPGSSAYDTLTGLWHSVSWASCRPPDRVTLRFRSGYALDAQGLMTDKWAQCVARLAAAELTPRIPTDGVPNRALWRWQFDLARAAGNNDEQYQISEGDLSNPFGTRAGQVWAWKQVRNSRLMPAIAV